ncbi:MAG: PepSY-like domain-containing protein [Flavobacteriales bacterium]|nr:PepSY-like domain-containing protein [Flavobacteriales bacterium]
MKKVILISSFAFTCFANTAFGQDIPQSQVPSVIVNNFQQTFPKAFDVDWELKGDNYKVEFETGLLGADHEAWYDKAGKLVQHKEEISKSDLPQKVLTKISSDFSSYRVEDVKKITEGNKVTYTLELKTLTEEWKVAFDSNGNVLSKVAD